MVAGKGVNGGYDVLSSTAFLVGKSYSAGFFFICVDSHEATLLATTAATVPSRAFYFYFYLEWIITMHECAWVMGDAMA